MDHRLGGLCPRAEMIWMVIVMLVVSATFSIDVACASGVAELSPHSRAAATVERRLVMMGTMARVVVTAPSRAQALSTTAAVEGILQEAERDLSTWKPDTDLQRLNQSPIGQGISLSSQVDAELTRALRCAEETQGAFDPTVGSLVEAYDLRGRGQQPDGEEIAQALERSGWGSLVRRTDGWTRHRDVIIEEGGFGKGAALDRVRQALGAAGGHRMMVDLGGQLLFVDARASASPWTVEVAHPEDRTQTLLRLRIPHGSVATSGNSERSMEGRYGSHGHLLDPRTGVPAPDFGSLTVWAPRALEADCLATGLFVMGPEAALDFAVTHPTIEVLALERSSKGWIVHASEGLRQQIDWRSPSLTSSPNAFINPSEFTVSSLLSHRTCADGICAALSLPTLSPARAIQRLTGGSEESFQTQRNGIFSTPFFI